MTIRVLIVKDQPITRLGIEKLINLTADLEVVGLAENGREAIAQTRRLMPDVVLMDIQMPVMNGKAATRHIMKEFPGCKILMLTTFDNDQYIVDALKAGAKGYLLKDMDMDKLAQAIRMAHQGYPQMSPGVLEKFIGKMAIVEHLGGKKTDLSTEEKLEAREAEKLDLTAFNNLTRREREILEAMSQGLNNREIAAALFLSVSTIRSHISNMVSSLNVEDRFELRFYAKKMFKKRHKPSTR
jgi:DNA-binding NarL/FixJ family response regulator